MAKKKRKRRSRSGPPPGAAKASASDRAARKEAARRERERAIRAYRRRRLLVRGSIALVVTAAVAVVTLLIVRNAQESGQRRERIDALAERLGCGRVEEADGQDARQYDHVNEPPQYETTPASYGSHAGQTLPPEVSVYDQPFDPAFEFRAVHNLEHGYVFMYYRQDGQNALDAEIVSALTDLAEGEQKTVLAPYPNLPDGENLALVAWNRIRRCSGGDVAPDDIRELAAAFIEDFREGSAAPEPNAI